MHVLVEWINKKEKKKSTSEKSKRGDPWLVRPVNALKGLVYDNERQKNLSSNTYHHLDLKQFIVVGTRWTHHYPRGV